MAKVLQGYWQGSSLLQVTTLLDERFLALIHDHRAHMAAHAHDQALGRYSISLLPEAKLQIDLDKSLYQRFGLEGTKLDKRGSRYRTATPPQPRPS